MSSRGLAFRGDNEILGDTQNGNYLGSIELIAKFDPFLSEHLCKYGNKGRGNVSYLSSTICDELAEIPVCYTIKEVGNVYTINSENVTENVSEHVTSQKYSSDTSDLK